MKILGHNLGVSMIDIGIRFSGQLEAKTVEYLSKRMKRISRKSLMTKVKHKVTGAFCCLWSVPEKDIKKVEKEIKVWASSVILGIRKVYCISKLFQLNLPNYLISLLYETIYCLGIENEEKLLEQKIDITKMVDIDLLLKTELKEMYDGWNGLVEPLLANGGISEKVAIDLLKVYSLSVKPAYEQATVLKESDDYVVSYKNFRKNKTLKVVELKTFKNLKDMIQYTYMKRPKLMIFDKSLTSEEMDNVQSVCAFNYTSK